MTSQKKDDVWKPIISSDGDDQDGLKTTPGAGAVVLIEIVSALRVPSMDVRSDSDPYVTVSVGRRRGGGKEIHRTKVLYNTPNPIWTIDSGSLFLLDLDHRDREGGGDSDNNNNDTSETGGIDLKTSIVTFTLKDYDATQADAILGKVEIKLQDLL